MFVDIFWNLFYVVPDGIIMIRMYYETWVYTRAYKDDRPPALILREFF